MKPPSILFLIVCVATLAFVAGRKSAPVASTTAAFVAPLDTKLRRPVSPSTPPPSSTLTGAVAELIQVPNYTYLRIDTGSGDSWAAVTTNKTIKQGDRVTLTNAMAMRGFTSPSLKRTFETIYFAQLPAN